MAVAAPALIAMMAISTAVSVASAVMQGQQASRAAKYNARVAENNAIAARQTAEFEEARQRQRASRVLASQRAALGASGVALEGSPLLAMADSAEQAELDALAIRYSGSVEEARHKSQAAADRLQASAARRAGYFGAATSLLRGMTSMASMGAGGGAGGGYAWAAGGGSASP